MKTLITLWVLLTALAVETVSAAQPPGPQRVVSLDYCADQYALKLLPRNRILALSPDATRPFSYLREEAKGIRQVKPTAEDVLTLDPDLVIRSYGGGAHTMQFFSRAGYEVLQIPFASTLDDIRDISKMVASRLKVPGAGEELVAGMDQRLAALELRPKPPSVLYMTPTGVTSGIGTLVNEMFKAAGLINFERRAGWHSLPLERLAYERPDRVAAAFFDAKTNHPHLWSAMRHPVAQSQMRDLPATMLQGAWTACGAWFLVDAIEALASS